MFRKWIVEQLGGYYPPVKAHDVLDARVSKLFSTIHPSDLLRNEKGTWYSEDRQLTQPEVQQIQAEARMLQNLFLWNELQKDVEYHAYRYIFTKSRGEFDLIGGKFLKLYIDIINTRIKEIAGS